MLNWYRIPNIIRNVLIYRIVHLTDGTCCHTKPFFKFLHKYPLIIGSLERSDQAELGISRTFEKNKILVKLWRKEKSDLRIQYMATWCDGKFDVNMTSLEVVRTRHHIRRFLRRSLVLKIKLITGQTLGTTDKTERRNNMAKSEGRYFWLLRLWRLSIVV